MRLTRRYRFSASHRLHAPQLGAQQNRELYGKCNNPFGHGHDYLLEVSVRGPIDEPTGLVLRVSDLDALVDKHVLQALHLRNLNTQVSAFDQRVPTTENLALEIQQRLARHWAEAFPGGRPLLERIRVHETRKNIIEIPAEGQ